MKIEKITDNKIRIILDIDELTEKNIDFLSLTKNTKETQVLFKKILKQAEKEVDFKKHLFLLMDFLLLHLLKLHQKKMYKLVIL